MNEKLVYSSQNGSRNGALTLVKIIAAVVGIAVIALLVYLSFKFNAAQVISNTAPTTGSNVQLDIPDWRVRMPLDNALKKLLVTKPIVAAGYQEVPLIVPELDSSWTCPADSNGSKGNIGYVTRQDAGGGSLAAITGIASQATVVIDNNKYVYWAVSPQGCTTNPKYEDFVGSFRASFLKLTAY